MNDLRADAPMARDSDAASRPGAPARRAPAARRPRRASSVGRLLRFLATLVVIGVVTAGVGGYAAWKHFSADLPDHAGLQDYEPAVMSRVYAGDSRLLAELATERRIFVPIEAIPELVQRAFVSAEDQNFWIHRGVDPIAIARAALTNLRHRGEGRRPVGASTITQQVAKNMLLTSEVSLARKAKEAILALRIEESLPKERILELYLNEIYLGAQAYGVAAAGHAYFNKALDELSLPEIAFLAALPKAPNNYNPFRNQEAARARRDWVLDRMAEDGVITREQATAAKAGPVEAVPFQRPETVPDSGYFAEEVRRQLVERFGPDRTTQGGLMVRTSLDPAMQEAAEAALRTGLMGYDRRRGGWRGPVAHIEAGAGWQERLAAVEPPPGMLAGWKLAVVLEVGNAEAKLGWLEKTAPGAMPEARTAPMLLADTAWARPVRDGRIGAAPRRMSDVLAAGDVVMAEYQPAQEAARNRRASPARLALRQVPQVEGALVALDPATGRVLAMAGGWSFERSQFNRATQAHRQPGSSFKPFVYMTAVEQGVSMSEQMLDAPFVLDLGPGGGRWRPNNYGMSFSGMVPLNVALARSLNLVTIRLADRVGLQAVADTAQRFGVIDSMPLVFPAALGAVETTVMRMAGGYAAFANGGKQVTPSLIDSVQDRDGRVIWRAPGRACAGCDGAPEVTPELTDERAALTSPENAYTMTMLLRGVVTHGTGTRAAQGLNREVAGKTGTTNDFLDAWFVGYTPDLVVAVWVGFDTPAPLGSGETGGVLAAPIFHDFLAAALADRPAVPFQPPPGVTWAGWPAASPDAPAAAAEGETGGGEGTMAPLSRGEGDVDSGLGGIY